MNYKKKVENYLKNKSKENYSPLDKMLKRYLDDSIIKDLEKFGFVKVDVWPFFEGESFIELEIAFNFHNLKCNIQLKNSSYFYDAVPFNLDDDKKEEIGAMEIHGNFDENVNHGNIFSVVYESLKIYRGFDGTFNEDLESEKEEKRLNNMKKINSIMWLILSLMVVVVSIVIPLATKKEINTPMLIIGIILSVCSLFNLLRKKR